jgi:hypothetical protein
MVANETVIATWFIADAASEATYFPQIGIRSDSPDAHKIYWRCVVCFYVTSLAHNLNARHVFFTNVDLPIIDGLDIAALFDAWGVKTVKMPVRHRLPMDTVSSWGNQFYILDIIDHFARSDSAARFLVLDSDCVWIRSVAGLEAAIDRHGNLTLLEEDAYSDPDLPINGLSRTDMAAFLKSVGGPHRPNLDYFGGEIFAATRSATIDIAERSAQLWPAVLRREPHAPCEEAHFLSIVAALRGDAAATANPFIRRMWTTFKHNTILPTDLGLSIWHLPAEKRSGFATLFNYLRPRLMAELAPAAAVPDAALLGRMMGVPRRSTSKFVADIAMKIREKMRV